MKRLLLISTLCLSAIGVVAGDIHIKGRVIDQDGKPIANARVYYEADEMPGSGIGPDAMYNSLTNSDLLGYWEMTISSRYGADQFSVTHPGYTSFNTSRWNLDFTSISEVIVTLYNALYYKAEEMATISLPITPDPTLGRYYLLDREEGNKLIFVRELFPKANNPYIFFPYKDVSIDISEFASGSYFLFNSIGTENVWMGGLEDSRYDRESTSPRKFYPFENNYSAYGIHADIPMHAVLAYTPEAFTEVDVQTGEVRQVLPELVFQDYRPLVERGKVWRTAYGPDVENAHNFYEYRFLGNVTVDGKECYLLGRSELAFNEGGVFYPIDTICVGALYEEGQKVYVAYAFGEERRYGYFNSNYFLESPVLLYDFASPVGTEIKLLQNGPKFSYIIADKSKGLSSFYQDMYNMTFNGNCTIVGIKLNDNIIEDEPSTVWLEGVGSRFSPLDNIYDLFQYGYMAERLLTCSVGDEILYMKGDLNSIWPDNDVKKQWLDFTHTVKPRPKAPRRSESVEASEEEESLTGEYSARELFVNLKTLDGAYTVTMRNSQSEEVYRKEVQTSNIVALNTDLTKYAKGTYTLVIENDAESYTATLTIGDEDGITSPMANAKESMFNVQWLMFNGIYDLTGRRLTSRPAKGLYIENQKLKVR